MKGSDIVNLPNKLTLFRILLLPFMVIINYIPGLQEVQIAVLEISLSNLLILILFIIGSFTDFLDGHIARKRNLITTFGKFMDPLADKLLVFTVLLILLEQGRLDGYAWIVIIILAREFLVTGIRLIAVSDNQVIAASNLGKAKTISQMLMIIVILLNNYPFSLIKVPMDIILLYVACLLTLISGVDYFVKNKSIILESK